MNLTSDVVEFISPLNLCYDLTLRKKGKAFRNRVRRDSINRSIQVIIAALNEESGVGPTIAELKKYLDTAHILLIDGKSTDRTIEIAKKSGADIYLQDGAGKGNAIASGVRHIDSDSDYVVLTDADFTYPAMYLPKMIQILEKNPNVGMVCGNRSNGYTDMKASEYLFYFGNRLLAILHTLLNGVAVTDPLTGLRVIRANIMSNWNIKSRGFDVEIELNSHVVNSGYMVTEMPIAYRKRLGEKKLKIQHGITILKRIILETILRFSPK